MIVVTGALGLIGSHLAQRLARERIDLLLVDHPLRPAKLANWIGLPRFRFLQHDEFLQKLPTLDIEAMYHLGACSDTTETDWSYLQANNIEYSQALWRYCADNRRPFVYASSAATYGDGSEGFDDRIPPDRLRPLNLYGRSKNEFDRWAMEQESAPPIWAGLKFFNVYGPREGHKGRMASVVWQAWKQIRESGEVRLFRSNDARFADGGQLRDFVFVEDCVDHILWFGRGHHGNGLYNSGTGKARSFLDLAHGVFAALGMAPNVRFIDMPADLAGKYQNYTQADMSKIRQSGFEQEPTPLEVGIRKYFALWSSSADRADRPH